MKRRRLIIPISTYPPNLCYCPDWPPFTVSGPSKHLSKASPPPGHQTSALLPVVASFSPAPSMFLVYASTRYFPSAYTHTVSFHIKKKRTSPDIYLFQLPPHFSDLIYGKTIEQTVFSFSSNFSPFIVSWSCSNQSFVAQDCHKTNPVMVQRLPSQEVHW